MHLQSAKPIDPKFSDCCQCPGRPSPEHCVAPPSMPPWPDVLPRYRQVPLTKDNLEKLLRKMCFHYCLTYLLIPPTWMGVPWILSKMLFLFPALSALLEKSSELFQDPGMLPHPSCLLLAAPPSPPHQYIILQQLLQATCLETMILQPLTPLEAFLSIQGTGEFAPHAGCVVEDCGPLPRGSAPGFPSNK